MLRVGMPFLTLTRRVVLGGGKLVRSRYKHFHDTSPYFVTCAIVNWIPVFTSIPMFEIAIDSLCFLRKEGAVKIYGYVILENHLHMIISAEDLSKNIGRFKSYTARKIIDIAKGRKNTWLLKQLKEEKLIFKNDRTYQLWQEGYHPKMIETEKVMIQKLEYIHNNPVKRGYVDDPASWVYSSARNYINGDQTILEIDLISL